jgi:transposase InsO family protein
MKAHHMLPSMSRKGNCHDNACPESFFSGLKNELTWDQDFRTRAEARSAIFEWIEVFYCSGQPNSDTLLRSFSQSIGVRYPSVDCNRTPS